MKNIKRTIRIVIALAVLAVPIILYAQEQEPEAHWEMATWAPRNPDGMPQTQDTSGEDWAYDVAVSYSGGSPDGYVYAGYTTFPDYPFLGGGGPCLAQHLTKGCARPKLFKTDLNGNLLWYEHYTKNEGDLKAVIPISGGGYLAVGRSREWDNRLTYYGKTASTNSLTCSSGCPRNIYAIKVDASGTKVWEKLYGIVDNPTAGGSSLLRRDSEAWDVVDLPNGNYRIVGQVLDPDDSARDVNGGYVTKAFVLEINSNGVRQWIRALGQTGNASIAHGIARYGSNTPSIVLNQFNQSTYASPSAHADIFVYQVSSSSSSPVTKRLTGPNTQHDFGFDVIYNTAGQILVSGVINCSNPTQGCFRGTANGEGTARVYRLSSALALLDSTTLGTVKAFDLWAMMAPTSDGGSVFVSTKQPDTTQLPGDFTKTDAYVAKLSQSMMIQWQKTYPARTTNTHKNDLGNNVGYTHQECLYAIVPAPGGGYVISGNNSSNFDDDYVVKFKDASSQTVSGTTVDHEHIYYFGPNNLTVGPSFTVQSTAYVELIARSSITISGLFEAKLGSEFEAEIDPAAAFSIASVPQWGLEEVMEVQALTNASSASAESQLGPALEQNYPNPFNPRTEISFFLPETGYAALVVYDVAGREVTRLIDGTMDAGTHRVQWDASSLPSGVYIYRLETERFTRTGRMTLVK